MKTSRRSFIAGFGALVIAWFPRANKPAPALAPSDLPIDYFDGPGVLARSARAEIAKRQAQSLPWDCSNADPIADIRACMADLERLQPDPMLGMREWISRDQADVLFGTFTVTHPNGSVTEGELK